MIAGLFPFFGVYRLARFNITPSKQSLNYFVGVPITAAGGILALLTLFHQQIPSVVITVVFTALCFLMVSRIRIPSMKKVPLPKYGTIVTIFVFSILLIIYRTGNFPYLFYIAIPVYILFLAYRFVKKNK